MSDLTVTPAPSKPVVRRVFCALAAVALPIVAVCACGDPPQVGGPRLDRNRIIPEDSETSSTAQASPSSTTQAPTGRSTPISSTSTTTRPSGPTTTVDAKQVCRLISVYQLAQLAPTTPEATRSDAMQKADRAGANLEAAQPQFASNIDQQLALIHKAADNGGVFTTEDWQTLRDLQQPITDYYRATCK